MLTDRVHGKPRDSAQFAVRKPENALLSPSGMTAAAFARRVATNDRGPAKGPLSVVSWILRGTASGRIFAITHQGEYA